jgi:hypothetical protein
LLTCDINAEGLELVEVYPVAMHLHNYFVLGYERRVELIGKPEALLVGCVAGY